MIDYTAIEKDFECACSDVIKELGDQYKSGYTNGGPGRLEAFLDLIKNAFEKAEATFISANKLIDDPEALRRIRQIAKKHAKKCLDDYGKLKLA